MTIFVSSHAHRRMIERAGPWGTVDTFRTAQDAWDRGRHIDQGGGRCLVRWEDGYTYIFALDVRRVILVTYWPTAEEAP